MKKPTKTILISLGALALITTIGGGVMKSTGIGSRFQTYINEKKEEKRLTTKEGQLAYLKEHQQEIKDFVKSQSPKVESVQIDWEQTQWEEPGMFQKNGNILLFGNVNNLANFSWGIDVPVDDDKNVDIDGIGLGQDITVGGDII